MIARPDPTDDLWLLAPRGDAAGARAELSRADASLRAQPQLGPHFERAVRAAEREIERVR